MAGSVFHYKAKEGENIRFILCVFVVIDDIHLAYYSLNHIKDFL